MAVVTTRRVIQHPPIPPGAKLRQGQVVLPPVDIQNGAVAPISARSKLGMAPAADTTAPVKTVIITEHDTKTGERRTHQEVAVDDVARIPGETNASFNARNAEHHKATRAEHQKRREHIEKVRKLQAEEATRAGEAEAEIEANRMEAHDKALDETTQRNEAVADAAEQAYVKAVGDAATIPEKVQAVGLKPALAAVAGVGPTGPGFNEITSVRTGSLSDDTTAAQDDGAAKGPNAGDVDNSSTKPAARFGSRRRQADVPGSTTSDGGYQTGTGSAGSTSL